MNPPFSTQPGNATDTSAPVPAPAPDTLPVSDSANDAAGNELRLRLLLGGDDEQINAALLGIHQHFRRVLCRWLMRLYPRLQEDAIDDVWADTLLAVLQAARKRRFRSDHSLWPWLCRIARSRVADHFRRCNAAMHLRHRLQQWQRRINHKAPPSPAAAPAEDIVALSMAFLPQLPGQQRELLRLVLEQLPERHPTNYLQEQLYQRLGRNVSRNGVKFSLFKARRKLAEFLQGHGYELPEHLR